MTPPALGLASCTGRERLPARGWEARVVGVWRRITGLKSLLMSPASCATTPKSRRSCPALRFCALARQSRATGVRSPAERSAFARSAPALAPRLRPLGARACARCAPALAPAARPRSRPLRARLRPLRAAPAARPQALRSAARPPERGVAPPWTGGATRCLRQPALGVADGAAAPAGDTVNVSMVTVCFGLPSAGFDGSAGVTPLAAAFSTRSRPLVTLPTTV